MFNYNLPTVPVLTTARLVLRDLRSSDAAGVLAMRSDPEVMRHVNRPLAQSVDEAAALIDLINSRVAAGESVQWAMTLRDNGRFVGIIGYWRFMKENHAAELGYMLGRDLWGMGYASEAIAAVLDFGFQVMDLHKVQAITRPENLPSIRALTKNGFVQEGHFRDDIFWNGAFQDSLYFAKLAQ